MASCCNSITERKAMIDRDNDLSITKQAEVLKFSGVL
jgi:hypothetical protein